MRSTDTGVTPYIGTYGYLNLGATGFVGHLKEVRIWRKTRSTYDIYQDMKKIVAVLVGIDREQLRWRFAERRVPWARHGASEDNLAYDLTIPILLEDGNTFP